MYTLFFLIILHVFDAYVDHSQTSGNKETHPTSVNVLYRTKERPIPILATSERRAQYITPHQTTTSNYQQTTVFTSQQKTRLLITNQTTHSIALDGYILRGMYNETKTTSLSMRRFKALR